jgi:uncharacterized protein YndB with AHSA1/START domain
MSKRQFVYVIYIKTTAEKLWDALTDPGMNQKFWFGAHQESDWKVGSSWKIVFPDGGVADTGEIIESDPPKRLVIKWRNEFKPELKAEGTSHCTMQIEPADGAVKLTITHALDGDGTKFIEAVSGGWPLILSNLKSLLETGMIAVVKK